MAAKVPIRAVFDGTTATGLAEFQSSEFIALAYGGLGASLSLGSAGQALKVNDAGNAVEFGAVTAANPASADGDSLGTASLEWSDLYLADGGVIYLGNDQDVTLTHVADTGILLNSTMQLQFNDSSQYINAPSNAILDINATDEIELNATLADVNANLDVSGTYTGGGLMTTGGNIVIPNDGNIGSASDTDLMTLGSAVLTISGELDATTLDISGDADIDGTLEADAITVDGTALAEFIADTAGGMVSSNTETGITVTYQDGDNTIDFAVDAAQTGITSIYNTSLAIGYGASHANIDFGTDNRITFDIDGTSQVILLDGVFRPTTDSDVDLGASAKYWKDAYIDTITTTGLVTAGGRLITDDATEATSTTDGSLQTDGGLSVVKDAVFGDDVKLLSDSAVLSFGADSEVTLTHVHNDGLLLNSDNQLQFRDSAINIRSDADGDLDINADDEIELNSTLIDINGNVDVSGTYTGAGVMTTGGNIVIPNAGNIGSVGDTDSIAIDSSGNITASQNLTVTGNFTVNGTTTTVATTNMVVKDNMIELNNGASSNANDSGLVIERGSTGDNAIIHWDESADKFQVGTTTATGSSTGNLTVATGTLVANVEGSGAGLTAGTTPLTTLDIDGGTDIGADLSATDLIIVDDGAGGTNRKAALSRVTTLTDASATALAIALG
jgi:hypothetical protein